MALNQLQSMIKQLIARGHEKSEAEKIATKHLQKTGVVKPGTMRISDVGKETSALSQSERNLIRISKKYGRPTSHFRLNLKGNRVLNPLFK